MSPEMVKDMRRRVGYATYGWMEVIVGSEGMDHLDPTTVTKQTCTGTGVLT